MDKIYKVIMCILTIITYILLLPALPCIFFAVITNCFDNWRVRHENKA